MERLVMNKNHVFLCLNLLLLVASAFSWWASIEIIDFKKRYDDTALMSLVKSPVRFALVEILDDINSKNYSSAQNKLNILSEQWNKFYNAEGIDDSFSLILYSFQTPTPAGYTHNEKSTEN